MNNFGLIDIELINVLGSTPFQRDSWTKIPAPAQSELSTVNKAQTFHWWRRLHLIFAARNLFHTQTVMWRKLISPSYKSAIK